MRTNVSDCQWYNTVLMLIEYSSLLPAYDLPRRLGFDSFDLSQLALERTLKADRFRTSLGSAR